MIPKGHRLRTVSAAEMAHYRAALGTRERRRASAIFPRQIIAGQVFLSGIAARLGELADRPALIIWGDADIAFRETELHRWEALLPDHETAVVFGAGHYVQSDAPEVVAQLLDGWLAARAGGGS
jgi:haloalkane dehalogenase